MSGSTSDRPETSHINAHSASQKDSEKPELQNRRLIVCCDGTWNVGDVDGQQLTNVGKIARCIADVDTWKPKKASIGDTPKEGGIMKNSDATKKYQATEPVDISKKGDQLMKEDVAKANDRTEAEKDEDEIHRPRNFVQIVYYQPGIGTGTGRFSNNLDAMTGRGEKIVLLKSI